MKHIKYILIVSVCSFALACSMTPGNGQKQEASIESDESIDANNMLYTNRVNTEAVLIVPSVEDSILQQIGGALHFSNGRMPPSDSITVIKAYHKNHEKGGQSRYYEFIVHSKNSSFHKPFTIQSLEKSYKAYFVEDADMPWNYREDYDEYYNGAIKEQKKDVRQIDIEKSIKHYTGYWIYLRNYNGQFYIDHNWSWLNSFRISDDVFTNHFMDGLYPSVIKYFKKEENGDFLIKTARSNEIIRYELVDKKRDIYSIEGGYYVVPAKNAHRFEIIEYANNTGDLM